MKLAWRLIAAALAVAILLALWAVSPPGRRWELARIESAAAAQGFELHAGGMHFRLYPPAVLMERVRVGSVFSAEVVEFDAQRNVTLTAPRFTVLIDEAGNSNLPKTGGGTAEAPPFRQIRLRNAALVFRDASHGLEIELERWDGLVSGSYAVEVTTTGLGRVTWHGRTESIESLRASYEGQRIKKFELRSSFGRAEVTGALGPQLDLAIAATADLARLDPQLRGHGSGDFRVTGSFEKPAVSGLVSAPAAYWRTIGPFAVEAELASVGESRGRLSFAALDAQQLEPLAGRRIPVATQISGNVSVHWPGLDGFAAAAGIASLRLTPSQRGPVPLRGPLQISVDARSARLETSGLDTGTVQASGFVIIDRRLRQLSGTLNGRSNDAAAMMTQLARAGLIKADLPPVAGPLALKASLAGTLARPTADFELASSGLRFAQAPEIQLAASGFAALDSVRIDALEARHGEARATLTGEASAAALRLDGTLHRTPLAPFTSLATGTVTGDFSIRGTAKQPEATAHVTAELDRWGNAQADLTYTASAGLVIPRFELRKENGSITGAVSGAYRATAEIRNYPLDPFKLPSGEIVSGLVSGQVSFDGPSLEGGTGTLDASIVSPPTGDVQLHGVLAGGEVKATAAMPAWGIDADLRGSIRAPYGATAEARLRRFALSHLAAIDGEASGVVRASGDLASPDSLRAEAELSTLIIREGGEEAANTAPVRVSYAGGIANIESASFASGDSRLSAQGRVPIQQGEAALNWDADLDVALAARLAKLDPALAPAGRLRAKGTLTGAAPDWKPDGAVELTGGRVNVPGVDKPITDLRVSASIHEGIARISEASASWLGGALRLSGEAAINRQEYRLNAELDGLRLEQFAAPSQVAGVVNLRAEASGKGAGVRNVAARVQAPGLRLQMGGLELAAKATPTVSLRDGLVQISDFELTGAGTQFTIRGGGALIAPYPLAVRLEGALDAALAGLFTDAVIARGKANLQVALTGTAENPRFGGTVELANIQATIPAAGAVLEGFNATVEMLGQQLTLTSAAGTLNGGSLSAKGTAELKNGALANVALDLASRNSAWNIPDGLQTAANLDLKLAGGGPRPLSLSGDVQILEGAYRERLVIERGLLNALQPSAAASLRAQERIPVNLDVRLRTLSPVLVSNDLLNGALNADLRVQGTVRQPGLTGRLDFEEGGTLYLGGRNYLVERASATFTNERRIEPVLDVLARTRAGGREVTLEARGALGGKLETRFTSDDALPEPDVIALLVTGRTLIETRGAEAAIASDQALSYLSGTVGGTLSQQANRALGFNFVRIDPSLIAQEAEPTARLTLGQDLTDRAGLVYSVNLKNSTDQIWIGSLNVTRRFSARLVRQSDNSYRGQFQHGIELGGDPPPGRAKSTAQELRVGAVTISGDSPIPEAALRKRFGLRTGKAYDFFKFRKGIDRVKDAFTAKGYPEASIRAERQARAKGIVDLALTVEAGAPVEFIYEGASVSRRVRRKVERAWAENSFDSLRTRQTEAVLREHLAGSRYYEARVDSSVQPRPNGGKRVLFEIARGPRERRLEFAFPGAAPENAAALQELFRDKPARLEALLKPEIARVKVADYYRGAGYLEAAAKPRVLERPGPTTLRYSVPVTEGARYRVGKVEVAGANGAAAPLQLYAGDPYLPAEADRAAVRIEESLESQGFTKAEAAVDVSADRSAKTVDLTYRVTPGDKQVIGSVEVIGNRYTSEGLVRGQIGLAPGEPVSSEKLSQARRNLYDTGAFAFTDLELQPGEGGPGGVATRLVARVREVRPYEVRYGGLIDSEKGPGVIADFSARNVLGAARLVGFRGRYDGQLHEARAYFEQPNLLRFPMKWVSTGFVRREFSDTFITDRHGASTTAEIRWRNLYRLNAGYRIEQVHTFEREPDPIFPFDVELRIAPLIAGFQRDTRDDILDAKRGSFFSNIAEWAPDQLGSEFHYAKYFGQYFHYRSLWGERRFVDAPARPGLVLAGALRFGIGAGRGGQELIPSERFYAGGGTSVRGFEQDRLGAKPGRPAEGGEGIWIANVEGRIPLFKYADVAVFADGGNVYSHWSGPPFVGARFSGGLGFRIRTPYVLVRLDFGIKFPRHRGETFGRLFGGIGQPF